MHQKKYFCNPWVLWNPNYALCLGMFSCRFLYVPYRRSRIPGTLSLRTINEFTSLPLYFYFLLYAPRKTNI